MKKRISAALLLFALLALPIQAALVRCLVVQLSNSTKLYYPTAQTPIVTFEGTTMHLNTDAMDISTIAKLTVESVELVGIENTTTAENGPVGNGQTLLLQTDETEVSIFNMQGIRQQLNIQQQGNQFSISLAELKPGTYLLKAGVQTWKFVKH